MELICRRAQNPSPWPCPLALGVAQINGHGCDEEGERLKSMRAAEKAVVMKSTKAATKADVMNIMKAATQKENDRAPYEGGE
ncbi:hypothetical protein N9L68_06185 [bacterium]|nr:hypothetical protein [bacterium]